MNQQPADSKNMYIKAMQILARALIMGLLLFAGIMVFLTQTSMKGQPPVTGMNEIFLGLSAVLLVFTGLTALWRYRKGVEKARNLTGSLDDKLNEYRSTLIIYLALSESGGLFSVISLFLTGDMRLLIITAISLLLMIRGYVTKKKLVSDLQLSWQEEQDL